MLAPVSFFAFMPRPTAGHTERRISRALPSVHFVPFPLIVPTGSIQITVVGLAQSRCVVCGGTRCQGNALPGRQGRVVFHIAAVAAPCETVTVRSFIASILAELNGKEAGITAQVSSPMREQTIMFYVRVAQP